MEEKKENIKKGGSSFLAYKITRKNGGTSFYFKSERLEKFFKSLAGEKTMMNFKNFSSRSEENATLANRAIEIG